jgi:hypothetical protein
MLQGTSGEICQHKLHKLQFLHLLWAHLLWAESLLPQHGQQFGAGVMALHGSAKHNITCEALVN